MQSDEMVSLLQEELETVDGNIVAKSLSNEKKTAVASSSSSFYPSASHSKAAASSSIRMTRQRFRQLANDKICPDLEELLSKLPKGPTVPKSFLEVDFPEDDPEDVEYDPNCDDNDEDDEDYDDDDDGLAVATGIGCVDDGGGKETSNSSDLVSGSNFAMTCNPFPNSSNNNNNNRFQPLRNPNFANLASSMGSTTIGPGLVDECDDFIPLRTRSRHPLAADFDIDTMAPLVGVDEFDINSNLSLVSNPDKSAFVSESAAKCSLFNPLKDDIYLDFLAGVWHDEHVDSSSQKVLSPPASTRSATNQLTDDDEDPDYNPLQDIDALVEYDPDEYNWDKRARIPKEEVRTLRKEALSELPIHCHLLETCAETVRVRSSSTDLNIDNGKSGVQLPNVGDHNQPITTLKRKRASSSTSSSSSSSRSFSTGSPSTSNFFSAHTGYNSNETATVECLNKAGQVQQQQQPTNANTSYANDIEMNFTATQILVLQEQMRKHIQLLTQTYLMAGNADDSLIVCQQSIAYLQELEMLRISSPCGGFLSLFNAFNLQPALDFLNKWPPHLIGPPNRTYSSSEQLERRQLHNVKRKQAKKWLCRPKLSKRQMDLFVYHCDALIYAGLLPTRNEGFFDINAESTEMEMKRKEWLPSEDDLLALGLEQFWLAGDSIREKAVVIQKYLLPTKSVDSIKARVKNVFYSKLYAKASSAQEVLNPIKIFHLYGSAPEYQTVVCHFNPNEVTPLRQLPHHFIPKWFRNRIAFWNKEAKIKSQQHEQSSCFLAQMDSSGGEELYYDKENDTNEMETSIEIARGSHSSDDDNGNGEGKQGAEGDDHDHDKLLFKNKISNFLQQSEQEERKQQQQHNKQQFELDNSISSLTATINLPSPPDVATTKCASSTVDLNQDIACFVTPVKQSCQQRQHQTLPSPPLASASNRPLLAKLISSLTDQKKPSATCFPAVLPIEGPSSVKEIGSSSVAHRYKRRRRQHCSSNFLSESEGGSGLKKLRVLAPAPLLAPMKSWSSSSSSDIPIQTTDTSSSITLKEKQMQFKQKLEESSTATASAMAIRRPLKKRLNEKQRLKMIHLLSATSEARREACLALNFEDEGLPIPLGGLAIGAPFNNDRDGFYHELATFFLDTLDQQIPKKTYLEILSILASNSRKHVDMEMLGCVKSIFSDIRKLLVSAGRHDLSALFALFLTSHQAVECECYGHYAEFVRVSEFLIQMHALAGSSGKHSWNKQLQNLIKLISSASTNFADIESECSHILNQHQALFDHLSTFYPNADPSQQWLASTNDTDQFEQVEFERIELEFVGVCHFSLFFLIIFFN